MNAHLTRWRHTMRTLLKAGTFAWMLLMLALVPVDAQNVEGFRADIREADPNGQVVIKVTNRPSGSELAQVYVTDAWYQVRCYQRQRVAKGFRAMWRRNGGSQVVVYDRSGTEVADFEMFGTDFDIRGCDSR